MECFKPLRNYLRKYNLTSMLGAVWHLSLHLEFKKQLPAYLRAANPWGNSPMKLGFFLWELDTLAREALLHCDMQRGAMVEDWPTVRDALNKIKKAEEAAYVPTDENVIAEIARIAHRQFHWQRGISHDHIARMRKLYRHPAMDSVVRDVYGLSTDEVAIGSFAAVSTYMSHFAIGPDWAASATEALEFNPSGVLDNLKADYPTLRDAAMNARRLDENWAYAFNPLWQFPLISIEGSKRLICPLPGLLLRRVTDGLYFDVGRREPDALGLHLGPAFQEYVGEVISRASSGKYQVYPEERFGPKRAKKDTVDWIVEDDSASLFVEVKLLRMGKAAKELLAPDEAVLREFSKMAAAVGQIYVTMTEAENGNYPTWKPSGKPIYPIIVTLDNWNLFAHTTYDILTDMVKNELARRGLDPEIVQRHRYVICSVAEFEHAIQVINARSVHEVMLGLTTGDKVGWLMMDFLLHEFREEVKANQPLFPDERDALLPAPMRQRWLAEKSMRLQAH